MSPKPGQSITVFFRAGQHLDGVVESWSDDKSVLKSVAGTSTLVIMKTSEDVLFYKFNSAKTDYQAAIEKPIKTYEDIKTIAELKNEINELEREAAREKLSQHEPSGNIKSAYNELLPQHITVKSPLKHTREETPRKGFNISSELSGMFKKRS